MRIKAEQLDSLASGAHSVWVVTGEPGLLVEEAVDTIRRSLRANGVVERDVFEADARFAWQSIPLASANLSLFASQRLIEIRLPSAAPGNEGAQWLHAFAASPPPDTSLLLILGKMQATQQKAKWFNALESAGVVVPIWPIALEQLPNWILRRAQSRAVPLSNDLAHWLADRVEGNLFAAAQEIDKLALRNAAEPLDEAAIKATIADHARYEAFGLVEAIYQGDVRKIPRMIDRLRSEGEDILAVVSALSWSVHRAVAMAYAWSSGQPLSQVFAAQRPPVWSSQQTLLQQTLQRHSVMRWQRFLLQLARIDRAAKGGEGICPWLLLQKLCMDLAMPSRSVSTPT